MVERITGQPEYVLAMIGAFISLLRLSGRVSHMEKALEKLETKHDALDNKIVEKLSLIEQSLARLEGRLSVNKEESS